MASPFRRLAVHLFWTTVIVGLLPFAVAGIPFSGLDCVNRDGTVPLFCQLGIERGLLLLQPWLSTAYIALLCVATLSAVYCRYWLRIVALLPLLILLYIISTQLAPSPEKTTPLFDRFSALKQKLNKAPDTFVSTESATQSSSGNTSNTTTFAITMHMATPTASSKTSISTEQKKPNTTAFRSQAKKPQQQAVTNNSLPSTKDKPMSGRFLPIFDRPTAEDTLGAYNEPARLWKKTNATRFHKEIWPIYSMTSLLALALLVGSIKIRSLQFGALPLFMLAALIQPLSQATAFSWASLFPLAIVLALSLVLRLLILAITQNIDIIKEMGLARSIINAFKTLTRWWVVALAALIGLHYASIVETLATDAVYCIGTEIILDEKDKDTKTQTGSKVSLPYCDQQAGLIKDLPPKRQPEDDINRSIDLHINAVRLKLNARLKRALADSDGSAIALHRNIMDAVYDGKTDPDPLFKENIWDYPSIDEPNDDCDYFLPDLKCIISDMILKAVNAAWTAERTRQKNNLDRELKDLSSGGEKEIKLKLETIEKRLNDDLNNVSLALKKAVSNGFLALSALDLFATLLLIFALVKSFAYVFARLAFNVGQQNYLPMEKPASHSQESAATTKLVSHTPFSSGATYHFPTNLQKTFLVSRKFDVSGVPASLVWPAPWQAIGRRISHGLWWMNSVHPDASNNPSIQTSQGAEFVEWALQAHERAYIDPANLVAFTRGMKLQTLISVRMTSLVFSRMAFLTVHGPGTLVIKTHGKAALFPNEGAQSNSFAAERFVAWSSRCKLAVSSQTGLGNIYFSGIQVALDSDSACIIDVAPDTQRRGGALRFIPACLLPF